MSDLLRPILSSVVTDVLDLSGFTSTSGEVGDAVGRRTSSANRQIDTEGYGWIAEVTVSEDHEDDLVITEHPVEYGAAITDHAYKRPAELRLRVGWSSAYIGDVRKVYEDIQYLQTARRPFSIYTGKRNYKDMLIASLRTQTNSSLEFTFLADITFKQIILVSTQTISSSANTENHADPTKTQSTVQSGSKQTSSVTLAPKQISDATGVPVPGQTQEVVL